MPPDAPLGTSASPSNPGTASPSAVHPRHEQMFPTLTLAEIDRLRRFGEVRRYADGDYLYKAGQPAPNAFIVIAGCVAITQRDGLGHVTPVVEQGPGQFLGEVGQLSNQPALVDGRAEGDVEALLISPDRLRTLLVAEAVLGERIMRALILRRVSLIDAGHSGAVLVGAQNSSGMVRLRGFLSRNGQPHHVLDPAEDPEAGQLLQRCTVKPEDLPLVICPNGTVLRNPTEAELARAVGMVGARAGKEIYDVAVVGAGPAGLSTAVYAASEGLSVVVLDQRAFGGQAGASARIENYFGFPTGITGQALTGRAYLQAQKFGAEMLIPAEVRTLDCSGREGHFALDLTDGEWVRARSIVIASGARYRRPAIERLSDFEGRGVWYWASPIEARMVAGEEVILVGGGNSAGQAAVFLSDHAAKIRMMVRGPDLAASMSRYLIDRIAATANIELMTQTEIVQLHGDAELERVSWRRRDSGEAATAAIRNVFLFAGADPATGWLDGCGVAVDKHGFVITGAGQAHESGRPVGLLESSVPGVFAVGDVRSGSVKRVGGAIGEGAQVVATLHGFLTDPLKQAVAPGA
jgi:thioredoxin reductase (NADPH)